MKLHCLTISSKNVRSIQNFLVFWEKVVEPNINLIRKTFQKRSKKKVLTLLKSPHVNKTAQEQFEFRTYSKQLWIYSTHNFNVLILLKKIKATLLTGAIV